MALLFMDGFDTYNNWTQASRVWGVGPSSPLFSTSSGRFGGGALILNSKYAGVFKSIPQKNEIIIGAAIRPISTDTGGILWLREATVRHVGIKRNGVTGALSAHRDSVVLGSGGNLAINEWMFVEAHVKINDSTGFVVVRVNGVEVMNITNVDTRNGGSGVVDNVVFCAPDSYSDGVPHNLDDVYILDTTGSTNNSFLGDSRIVTLRPAAAGASTDFTPSAGDNYECVDDAPGADDDASYVEAATTGMIDMYKSTTVSELPTAIHAVQLRSTSRKTDAGSMGVRNRLTSGSTTVSGHTPALSTDYSVNVDVFEADPDTGNAWTLGGVNSIEAGVETV